MDNCSNAVNDGVMTVSPMMRAPNGRAGRLAHRIAHQAEKVAAVVIWLPGWRR
jgi:hypothetical protein